MGAGDYVIRVGDDSRRTVPAAVLRLDREVVTRYVNILVVCDRELDLLKLPEAGVPTEGLGMPEGGAPDEMGILKLESSDAFVVKDDRLTEAPVIRTYIPEGKNYSSYIEDEGGGDSAYQTQKIWQDFKYEYASMFF